MFWCCFGSSFRNCFSCRSVWFEFLLCFVLVLFCQCFFRRWCRSHSIVHSLARSHNFVVFPAAKKILTSANLNDVSHALFTFLKRSRALYSNCMPAHKTLLQMQRMPYIKYLEHCMRYNVWRENTSELCNQGHRSGKEVELIGLPRAELQLC